MSQRHSIADGEAFYRLPNDFCAFERVSQRHDAPRARIRTFEMNIADVEQHRIVLSFSE